MSSAGNSACSAGNTVIAGVAAVVLQAGQASLFLEGDDELLLRLELLLDLLMRDKRVVDIGNPMAGGGIFVPWEAVKHG